ncbi:MAG: AbrB family transcriptional regulator [Rhodomicrobium sp.]|nr:AbrB family transcriptional regulator [Rhodomicrobium sp.]
MLFGGMIGGAALHLSGALSGQMPPAVLIPCQVLMGCLIGLRFLSTDIAFLGRALMPSFGAFLLALAVSVTSALIVAYSLDIPPGTVIIAFAPGGLETMTIIAFVLGLDTAFVAAHQLARFIGLSLLLPLAAKLYLRE